MPQDTPAFTEGYNAQVRGVNMVAGNPYDSNTTNHWEWRRGYLQAFNDSH